MRPDSLKQDGNSFAMDHDLYNNIYKHYQEIDPSADLVPGFEIYSHIVNVLIWTGKFFLLSLGLDYN
jgi:hypothetical protein